MEARTFNRESDFFNHLELSKAQINQVKKVHNMREQIFRELENLSAVFSHRLRNPLGSISIYANLLERCADSDKASVYADKIGEESKRMDQEIEDIIHLTKKPRFNFEPVDITGNIKKTISNLSILSRSMGVNFDLFIDETIISEGSNTLLETAFLHLFEIIAEEENSSNIRITAKMQDEELIIRIATPDMETDEARFHPLLGDLSKVHNYISANGGCIAHEKRISGISEFILVFSKQEEKEL
jgi:signal transduction histidine kinase